jgi:acyl-CoA reductase-like NAD-dependent aldehyde dehydrogenase
MSDLFQDSISPIDGSLYARRPTATKDEIAPALSRARVAFRDWRQVPVPDRVALCRAFARAMVDKRDLLGVELAWQMGRPVRYGPREIDRTADRTLTMCDLAEDALADIVPDEVEGFHRAIKREPLGLVFIVAPWNYPYLTAINSVAAALLAGNVVLLKPSSQTLLTGERMAEAFAAAGLPEGVFQVLHLGKVETRDVVRSPEVDFLAFTGSVPVGRLLQQTAADRFIGVGMELGGKDPAYVRPDANLDHAVENLVDGAMFNSGQSCCGIERIYIHADVYERFVEGAVDLIKAYALGNPLEPETTLGPMVHTSAAEFVRIQTREAVSQGARALIDESLFPGSRRGTPYLAPQLLVNVDHSMRVMTEESFGPVVGIMKVNSDEEAVRLMNDSPYGLTASVWTEDFDAALRLGGLVETGTWFMNRCDYLDPALAWTGVKDSGRGCTLSKIGFEQLTRPKSFHMKLLR